MRFPGSLPFRVTQGVQSIPRFQVLRDSEHFPEQNTGRRMLPVLGACGRLGHNHRPEGVDGAGIAHPRRDQQRPLGNRDQGGGTAGNSLLWRACWCRGDTDYAQDDQ